MIRSSCSLDTSLTPAVSAKAQGSVALSVADDAYDVAFFISFADNPHVQSDFQSRWCIM